MTRKHYVMIAESIKGAYSNIDPTYGGDASMQALAHFTNVTIA